MRLSYQPFSFISVVKTKFAIATAPLPSGVLVANIPSAPVYAYIAWYVVPISVLPLLKNHNGARDLLVVNILLILTIVYGGNGGKYRNTQRH